MPGCGRLVRARGFRCSPRRRLPARLGRGLRGPCTCIGPVSPGLIIKRMRCRDEYRSTSSACSGRGPTRLMSPRRTFTSCGSSSMLHRRSRRPTLVTRGSCSILKTGSASLSTEMSDGSSSSAWRGTHAGVRDARLSGSRLTAGCVRPSRTPASRGLGVPASGQDTIRDHRPPNAQKAPLPLTTAETVIASMRMSRPREMFSM